MSTSSSDNDTSDSESNHLSRVPSPPPFQGPPAASTRSKKSKALAQSTADPGQAPHQSPAASTRSKKSFAKSTVSPGRAPLSPQPPSASTRASKLSVQSAKSGSPIKPWMVNTTKSVIRPHYSKAISPVASSGENSGSTTLPSDVEVVEIVAAASQTPKLADVSHAESGSSSSAPKPARLIPSKTFREAARRAFNCRESLKVRYQSFLRELDKSASHYRHLVEQPTLEASLPQLLQALTFQNSAVFFNMADRRRSWETVKDLDNTELLVFETLTGVTNLLNAKAELDKSEADMILGQLATVNTAIEAFCTRMSGRITLTAEQNTIFGESDLTNPQLLYFRLASTDKLPSVEERFRLLWAVHPIHGMRIRFHAWNQALSANNAALKGMLETLSATIEGVEPEARGVKRKAEDKTEDGDEQ